MKTHYGPKNQQIRFRDYVKSNNIYTSQLPWFFFPTLVVTAVILLAITIFALVVPDDPSPQAKKGWFAFWTLVPASYFTFEYHFLYPTFRNPDVDFEKFKHGQEVASKFWAGVVALVGVIAFKDLV